MRQIMAACIICVTEGAQRMKVRRSERKHVARSAVESLVSLGAQPMPWCQVRLYL